MEGWKDEKMERQADGKMGREKGGKTNRKNSAYGVDSGLCGHFKIQTVEVSNHRGFV
jgi:hypothetical protein